jgi:hypothetical protein
MLWLAEPFRITVDYLPIEIHCSTVILNGSANVYIHQRKLVKGENEPWPNSREGVGK